MTIDSVIAAHRKKLLTRAELFASLTAILSACPGDLATVRGAIAIDASVANAFEDWLDELKCYPVIALGDRPVMVSRGLVDRLGPPNMPAAKADADTGLKIITMAKVHFDLPPDERPRGTFGAQVRVARGDSGSAEHYSVVVRQVADVDAGDIRDVAGFIGLVAPDPPADLLRGTIELFRNGVRIGVASITRLGETTLPSRDRRIDFDFLEASP